jgi:hypothetical protein
MFPILHRFIKVRNMRRNLRFIFGCLLVCLTACNAKKPASPEPKPSGALVLGANTDPSDDAFLRLLKTATPSSALMLAKAAYELRPQISYNIPQKGEFETTAAWNERIEALRPIAPQVPTNCVAFVESADFSYNADTEIVQFHSRFGAQSDKKPDLVGISGNVKFGAETCNYASRANRFGRAVDAAAIGFDKNELSGNTLTPDQECTVQTAETTPFAPLAARLPVTEAQNLKHPDGMGPDTLRIVRVMALEPDGKPPLIDTTTFEMLDQLFQDLSVGTLITKPEKHKDAMERFEALDWVVKAKVVRAFVFDDSNGGNTLFSFTDGSSTCALPSPTPQ